MIKKIFNWFFCKTVNVVRVDYIPYEMGAYVMDNSGYVGKISKITQKIHYTYEYEREPAPEFNKRSILKKEINTPPHLCQRVWVNGDGIMREHKEEVKNV